MEQFQISVAVQKSIGLMYENKLNNPLHLQTPIVHFKNLVLISYNVVTKNISPTKFIIII